MLLIVVLRLNVPAGKYPYGYTYLAKKKAQGLKPKSLLCINGPTKVAP